MISIVTAKVVRKNEQYNYRLVGKGERYLVSHEDGESAGDKVVEYLTPYAEEPVVIEATSLQKSTEVVIVDGVEESDTLYKASVQEILVSEDSGKVKRITRKYFVLARNFAEAHENLEVFLGGMCGTFEIGSITKTNIIEYLM